MTMMRMELHRSAYGEHIGGHLSKKITSQVFRSSDLLIFCLKSWSLEPLLLHPNRRFGAAAAGVGRDDVVLAWGEGPLKRLVGLGRS
jgi:hypothetical protein